MVCFAQNDSGRLDYRLLQKGSVTLYLRPKLLADDIASLKALGYLVIEFDPSAWNSEADFYESVAKALRFPDYFGKNLDALNDCLAEIDIPSDAGLVIVFAKIDLFRNRLPDFAWNVLDILSGNARRHLLFGRRLICLLQSNDPSISFDPVGAQPVVWNDREWLKRDRGL